MDIMGEAQKLRDRLEEDLRIKVSIALFGRTGVGKSTLLDNLLGEDVADVGAGGSVTKKPASHEWKQFNGVRLVDLPGYDAEGLPKSSFFEKMKIPEYDLFLCVFTDRPTATDIEFWNELQKMEKPCLFVRSKAESIKQKGKTHRQLEQEIVANVQKLVKSKVQVYFTSCDEEKTSGLGELASAIADALEGAKRARWLRTAKAHSQDFLKKKREACEEVVMIRAGLSAANALNPIPGVDISVDLGILLEMFAEIRSAFGLSEATLKAKSYLLTKLALVTKNILYGASKEGVLILLKRFAGRQALKEASKWFPLIGTIIAATAGFALTSSAGSSYLEDCYVAAQIILDDELKRSSVSKA